MMLLLLQVVIKQQDAEERRQKQHRSTELFNQHITSLCCSLLQHYTHSLVHVIIHSPVDVKGKKVKLAHLIQRHLQSWTAALYNLGSGS